MFGFMIKAIFIVEVKHIIQCNTMMIERCTNKHSQNPGVMCDTAY